MEMAFGKMGTGHLEVVLGLALGGVMIHQISTYIIRTMIKNEYEL